MEDKNELHPELPEEQLPAAEEAWDAALIDTEDIPQTEIPAEPSAEEFVASFFADHDLVENAEDTVDIPTEMPEMTLTPAEEPTADIDLSEYIPEDLTLAGDLPADALIAEDDEDHALFASIDDTQRFIPQEDEETPSPEELSIEAILSDYVEDTGEPDPDQPYDPFAPDAYTEPAVDEAFRGTEEEKQEFDEMFAAEPQSEEPPPPKKHTPRTVRKGRPKRRKGDGLLGLPHLLVTLVWLAIIVAIGSCLGKLLWVGAADVLAFGRVSKPVTVTIEDSDTLDTIALKLQEAGLVKYPGLFKLYIQITGSEDELITGYFELNTNLDYHALTNALSPSSSSRTVIEVMIPEGYNCRQIFALLEENHVCSVSSLEAYAADGEFADFWFLEGLERGDKYCLEGFLFPDTYQFYVNSTPREALGKMLTGFDNRFSDEMQDLIPVLNERFSAMMRSNGCSEEHIAEHQLTARDVVIVASLIEEETASATESSTIASVIYNRLAGKNVYDRYLNIDASIYYALGGNVDPETGKTMPLTAEDLKLDSPFNTYTNAGLTPTPISNPGLASLQAALEPADTGYFYYVLNPETRLHQFSKTLEEHEKWVAQFREAAAE